MDVLSFSRSCVMVWPLKTLILEEINPVSKSNRHDPSINIGRRTIKGPVRCITQEGRSQVSNNHFPEIKGLFSDLGSFLAVRRSSLILF
jgi:hypothetical protein